MIRRRQQYRVESVQRRNEKDNFIDNLYYAHIGYGAIFFVEYGDTAGTAEFPNG
jgi:hypothetical protein